jgi:hypothetical protein
MPDWKVSHAVVSGPAVDGGAAEDGAAVAAPEVVADGAVAALGGALLLGGEDAGELLLQPATASPSATANGRRGTGRTRLS